MSENIGHGVQSVAESFKKQEAVFRNFYAMHNRNTLGTYFDGLGNLEGLFLLDDRCFRCMDERTPGGIHAAGPMILLEEEKGIHMLKVSRAEGIYSHVGCGAAGIAFERISERMRRFYVHPDNYGMFYAKAIAKKAGIPYMGHMAVEPNFHVARMAIYDGTGSFDNSAHKMSAAGLPPAFVISRRYHLEPANAMREASIAAAIAIGDHGYGRLIKADKTPFLLLVVGARHNKDFSFEHLMDEAKEVAKPFDGKVIVDGFVAPA
jgi:hypothetical protein